MMTRSADRSAKRYATTLVVLLAAAAPRGALACPDEDGARAALERLRTEITALYREASGIEQQLDAALAERARRQGWSAAQTEDFRRSLLEGPEYRELEAQRLADIPRLATATANLVTLSTESRPSAICTELPGIRFANQRMRTLLDLEYQWLERRIKGG